MDIIKNSALYFAIKDEKSKKKAKKYKGLKSKMPQEAKDQLKAEKPEHYKSVFGQTEVTEVVVDQIVTE